MPFNTEITWVVDTDLSGGNPPETPTQVPPSGPLNNAIYQVFQNTEDNKARIDALNPADFSGPQDHNTLGNLLGGNATERYHLDAFHYNDLTNTTQAEQDASISALQGSVNSFSSTLDQVELEINEVTTQLPGIQSIHSSNVTRVNNNTTLLEGMVIPDAFGEAPTTPFWQEEAVTYSKSLVGLSDNLLFTFTPVSKSISAIYVRGFAYLNNGGGYLTACCTRQWQVRDMTLMDVTAISSGLSSEFSFKVSVDYSLGEVRILEGNELLSNITGGIVELCGMINGVSHITFTPST